MLKVDYSVFIQIANFLILLFLLNAILFRPVRKVLTQRKTEMDRLDAVAADLQLRAATHSKELEDRMAAARREGSKAKESLSAEGLELEKRMVQEAAVASGRRMETERMAAEEKVAALRETLVRDVELFSRELAEKILGRSL